MAALSIERRYCGPPGHAHGGYLCGRLAEHAQTQLRIRIERPVPLELPLQIDSRATGELELRHADVLFARALPDALTLSVPAAPTYLQALEASKAFIGFKHHAFPACFACGTERAHGDGLRIFAGVLSRSGQPVEPPLVAATWVPDVSLPAADGKVRPEFMAAALDCPGYYAARQDSVPMLLGEFTAHVDRCVHVDEPCTVIGWPIAVSGRKYTVGTALFDEDGELCARARAVWIEPRGSIPGASA